MLLVVTILMRASQNMAQTTFPLVAADLLHISATGVGIVAAVSGGVGVVTMVWLAARIRPGRAPQTLLLAILVMALAFPLLGEAPNTAVLVVGAVVLGFGGGLAIPTLITAAGQMAGDQPGARDRPIALFGVALSVSLAIGPFVETAVLAAQHGNVRQTFLWFTIAPVLAVVILSGVILRRRPRASTRADNADNDKHAPASSPPSAAPSPATAAGRLSLAAAMRDPGFRVALFGQLIYAAPFVAIVVFGALLARHDYGASPAGTQLAFGVFFAVSFAVRLLLAWQSPIPHKMGLFRLSAALTLLGIVVLATGHGNVLLLVAMGLLGVPHGLTFPLSLGLVAENRPPQQLASVNAHLSASVQVVNLALPFLLGIGIDAFGYRLMFLVLVVPVVAAGLLQQLAARHLRLSEASRQAAQGI